MSEEFSQGGSIFGLRAKTVITIYLFIHSYLSARFTQYQLPTVNHSVYSVLARCENQSSAVAARK